jgi:hypothetical protein
MLRTPSFVMVACLAVAGFAAVGCNSGARPSPEEHDALFGVGTGEFGESTTIAGDYDKDLHHSQAAPPVAPTE